MQLPMGHEAEMRRCLEALDVEGVRKLWAHIAPQFARCTDAEALAALHMARTAAESLPLRLRAYSHRWLSDHGYPSALPDALRPRAERIYPKIVTAVGISVISKYRQVADEVGGAMLDVVENAYADGKEDPEYIRPRMLEARLKARKQLGL